MVLAFRLLLNATILWVLNAPLSMYFTFMGIRRVLLGSQSGSGKEFRFNFNRMWVVTE